MSDLDDAIQAAVDVPGALVVGFVLVACFQTAEHDEGECSYVIACPPGQMHHSTIGLLGQGVDLLCCD